MAEMRKEKRVIINADDFGFSMGISEGILQAHREGIVTSTTVTANMPSAEDAVRLLADAPELGVGVHLNVSQGSPLSRDGRALGDKDGVMRSSGIGVVLTCIRRPRVLSVIEAEYEAQIRWILDHGIHPTHLDTHRHAHAFAAIFARVVKLARRYHIRFIRRHREVLPGPGWPDAPVKRRCVSHLLNLLGGIAVRAAPDTMGTSGTWGVAHTGRIAQQWLIRAAQALPAGTTEIMTHPGLGDDLDAGSTRLLQSRRAELEALCSPAVKEAFEQNEIELTHYGRL